MLFSSWLRNWRRSAPAARRRTQTPSRPRASVRPRLEALEDRWLPSTLTVTNTQDHGHGSLRAEIAAAQNGDTIVFSPTLNGKTITLTSGELDLTKNLTMQGPGAGQLTISGPTPAWYTGQYSRVFEVAPNTAVTLSGLTISNGDGHMSASSVAPWDGSGGGILNHGTLTLSACTISHSYAYSSGGGIFSDGTLTVSGCTVSGNEASDGGGIFNRARATFVSSAFSNNDASDTSSGSYLPDGAGGGIFNDGTLKLSGCTVSFNYSNGAGGGICNGSTLTLSGCTVSGNSAGCGAGIANSGTATLVSSTISNNNAFDMTGGRIQPYSQGGGILNDGTLTLSGCTVTGNFAEYEGGGIYNATSGTVTVENGSSIAQDVCNLGVLYLDSTSTIGYVDGNPAIPI